jgi:hypothetical protein
MIFSKIVFANFIGENTVVFLTKHCQLLQCFSSWFFSFQNYLCWFFFNIKLVENLALQFFFFLLTGQLNHVGKALYLSSQNTVDCYKSLCSVSKFFDHQHNFFFPSWNIGLIIPLVSITYLALIYNYNTIKYICFISPRQCGDMPSLQN